MHFSDRYVVALPLRMIITNHFAKHQYLGIGGLARLSASGRQNIKKHPKYFFI